MNEVKVVMELCAEDRVRLDKIIEGLASRCDSCLATIKEYMDTIEGEKAVQDASKERRQLFPNIEGEGMPDKKTEPINYAHTVEEIQKKVMELCAGKDKETKAAVRNVINFYAPKVSDLVEKGANLDEVWSKLIALEVRP